MTPMKISLWERLPNEIKTTILLFTDIDTAILNDNVYALSRFLQNKKQKKNFNWTYASSHGKLIWLKYMLRNNLKTVYTSYLVELALRHSHIECASWLWSNKEVIRKFLWENKRQRYNNKLVRCDTLETFAHNRQNEAVLWLLKNTTVKFRQSVLYRVDATNEIGASILKYLLQSTDKRMICDIDLSVPILAQIRCRIFLLRKIRNGTLCEWWSRVTDVFGKHSMGLVILAYFAKS